jgi:hypothetical protein
LRQQAESYLRAFQHVTLLNVGALRMIQQLRLVQLMSVTGLVTLFLAGCSGNEDPSPAPYQNTGLTTAASSAAAQTGNDDSQPSKPAAATCVDRQVRECHVALGAQGAVQNCFVGLQLCADGQWGPCLEPSAIDAQLDGS